MRQSYRAAVQRELAKTKRWQQSDLLIALTQTRPELSLNLTNEILSWNRPALDRGRKIDIKIECACDTTKLRREDSGDKRFSPWKEGIIVRATQYKIQVVVRADNKRFLVWKNKVSIDIDTANTHAWKNTHSKSKSAKDPYKQISRLEDKVKMLERTVEGMTRENRELKDKIRDIEQREITAKEMIT